MESKYYGYKKDLLDFLTALNKASNTGVLANPLLAIGGTKSQMKTTNAISYVIDGILYTKSATASIAFTATDDDITANMERQYLVSIDADGDITVTAGDEAEVGASELPSVPADSAVIGSLKIALDNDATFDATTTLLDASDVTTTYTQGYNRSVDDVVELIS